MDWLYIFALVVGFVGAVMRGESAVRGEPSWLNITSSLLTFGALYIAYVAGGA